MKISLTNVRGFSGTHKFVIKPITLLIGENSSGKSTLLAAMAVALNPDFPGRDNLFNQPPFDLGSFDTIATRLGGGVGRAEAFSVGWDATDGSALSVLAKFISEDGYPKLGGLMVKGEEGELNVDYRSEKYKFTFKRSTKTKKEDAKVVAFDATPRDGRAFRLEDVVRYYLDSFRISNGGPDIAKVNQDAFQALYSLSLGAAKKRPHATALAPLRTKPRRTYDDLSDEFRPEGDHLPFVLSRLVANHRRDPDDAAYAALIRYGQSSGLFQTIDIKRLGKQPSDPLQVRVKTQGPDANLMDVGYGVSQALPIVIDSIRASIGEVLLIQQPEVHLHPKAQAALGTFFCELAAKQGKQFVIETHSDYLVDRVRLAVAEKVLAAADVQLLYFTRSKGKNQVHELHLDQVGNIENPPRGYRNFFLEEEMKILSRA